MAKTPKSAPKSGSTKNPLGTEKPVNRPMSVKKNKPGSKANK